MADINIVLDQLKNKLAELIIENAVLKAEVEELSGKATGNNEVMVKEAATESG
jgi:regulator of replication initiation timing